ncbi:MAG: helix-turn-helix domain-containing protein, partial [Saprospiraceae bacterium]
PFYLGISFSYSIMIVVFGAYALKIPSLFELPLQKYQASNLDQTKATKLFQQLKNHLETEKIFLDPDLTLAKLSQQIKSTPKEVSQAINQVKQLNYSQFIAQYRVHEAQRLLQSLDHAHLKISAIAYDSGFNSISSFNAQFKKVVNQTAKAYRKEWMTS